MKKLGFGFMRLPLKDQNSQKSIDTDMLKRMVDAFLEKGFTYFDTAYMYHDFTSEIALRESLVKRHPRGSFSVATKLPTMFLKEEGDQERIFAEQLEKCGVSYFDYYLLHNLGVENYERAEKFKSFDFISRMKKEGKIRNIGFSYHDNAQLLEKILTAHPEVDFVQLQINYLDWDSESIQSRKCHEVVRRHNKPVIVMEPVKGGALADVSEKVKDLFLGINSSMSAASWAIRYAASLDGVMTVLSGMSDYDQLRDNISFMDDFIPMNEEEKNAVASAVGIINESIAIPCTACHYCEKGCPQNIPIAKFFSMFNAEMQTKPKGFSIQRVYYDNCINSEGKASDCISCARCERSCPQHIGIMGHLKKVADIFEAPLAF